MNIINNKELVDFGGDSTLYTIELDFNDSNDRIKKIFNYSNLIQIDKYLLFELPNRIVLFKDKFKIDPVDNVYELLSEFLNKEKQDNINIIIKFCDRSGNNKLIITFNNCKFMGINNNILSYDINKEGCILLFKFTKYKKEYID